MTTMAPARPAMTRILCRGTLHNGKPCGGLLFKAAGLITTPIEIKCQKCGRIEWFGPVE